MRVARVLLLSSLLALSGCPDADTNSGSDTVIGADTDVVRSR